MPTPSTKTAAHSTTKKDLTTALKEAGFSGVRSVESTRKGEVNIVASAPEALETPYDAAKAAAQGTDYRSLRVMPTAQGTTVIIEGVKKA